MLRQETFRRRLGGDPAADGVLLEQSLNTLQTLQTLPAPKILYIERLPDSAKRQRSVRSVMGYSLQSFY